MPIADRIFFLMSRRWLLLFAVGIYVLGLIVWLDREVLGRTPRAFDQWNLRQNTEQPASSIPSLFGNLRLPVDADNFTDPGGRVHSLPYFWPQNPPFSKPLGNDILILDADTRPLNETGEVLNAASPYGSRSWQTMGRLNHYLFAKIHGYDYKLLQVRDSQRRYGTWSKVPAIRQQLHHYRFVIFLDADTIFPYLHLPLEWLLNYWNIAPETLIALARDPSDPVNNDDRSRTLLNTGFIIAQQSPRAMELFKAWDECPTETRYPKCSRWRFNWPHEQGAFGNFIRYDFNVSGNVKVLPCAEANGCPESAHTGCTGRLVRHYWYGKALVPGAVQDSILRSFVPRLHDLFLGEFQSGLEKAYLFDDWDSRKLGDFQASSTKVP